MDSRDWKLSGRGNNIFFFSNYLLWGLSLYPGTLLELERSHCPQCSCRQLYKYVKAASVTGRSMGTECWSTHSQSSRIPATLTHFITCTIYQLFISATDYFKKELLRKYAFFLLPHHRYNVLPTVQEMTEVILFSWMPSNCCVTAFVLSLELGG